MSLKECQLYVKPYVVKLGTEKLQMFLGPMIKGRLDAYHIKVDLGVDVIINMVPHTDEEHWNGQNRASPYMGEYEKEGEYIEELKDSPPKLYRDAALPLDPLDQQSETRQIDFYCLRARKVASYLKEHPQEIPYFHYRDGTNEDALLAFLVWYILDKQSCPWENLTAWLISDEIDQKQVLSDDTQIELFGKLVKRIDATAKNQVMTNWLKKAKK